MNNFKVRLIYDYNLTKYNKQYMQIQKIIPKHELYIYKYYDSQKFEDVDCNIYMDSINENIYLNSKTKFTILLVNEEYINNSDYIRRENYIDKPLIKIYDIVDYYLCFSDYTYNILISQKKVNNSKILLLNSFISNNMINKYKLLSYDNHIINQPNYILYDIDIYSFNDNLLVLKTWLKYFSNRKEILIIKYKYKELFIKEFQYITKQKINNDNIIIYKNIILFKNDNYMIKYELNINCVLILSSYFQLITSLNEHICKKHFIITLNNEISNKYIKNNDFLLNELNEDSLCKTLNLFFSLTEDQIQNNVNNSLKQLKKYKNKSKEKIKFLFKNIRSNK